MIFITIQNILPMKRLNAIHEMVRRGGYKFEKGGTAMLKKMV